MIFFLQILMIYSVRMFYGKQGIELVYLENKI